MRDNNRKQVKMSRHQIDALIIEITGAVLLLADLAFVYFNLYPLYAILASVGVYLIVLLAILIKNIAFKKTMRGVAEQRSSAFENLTLECVRQLYMPVIICSVDGKVIWHNEVMSRLRKGLAPAYGQFLDSFCDVTLDRILKGDSSQTEKENSEDPFADKMELTQSEKDSSEDGILAHFTDSTHAEYHLGKTFKAKGYSVRTDDEEIHMVVFREITDIVNMRNELQNRDVVVAYVVIDNVEEIQKLEQTVDSMVLVDINSVLRKVFEDELGGVIKENGKYRYLCVFDRENLGKLEQSKFSFLDDVKDVSKDSDSIPLTISVGVGANYGSLFEKEAFAQSALELALQRGGDQAVVKSRKGNAIYGGKVKTAPKGSTVRSRVIATEFLQMIKKSSNVLVMGHKNADYDALGSCLAVSRIAKYYGVKVNIISDVNDKNLAPAFAKLKDSEYDNLFVDAVEAQDLLKSETLTVVVDVNNIQICEAPDVVANSKNIVIIDHHRKVSEYDFVPNIQYIEPTASSAAELLSEFLQQLIPPNALPKVEADIIFSGIVLDTKRFSHNTGIRTFNSALYLRSQGADPSDVNEMFKTDLKDLIREAKYENSVITYKSVFAIALNNDEDNSPLARISAAKAADRLLSVNGVLASFALCKTNDTVFISARSQGSINVQLILEKMGGGGHYDAAGAQVAAASTNDVLAQLKDAINSYLEENT